MLILWLPYDFNIQAFQLASQGGSSYCNVSFLYDFRFFLECPIPWSLQEIRAHDAAVAGQMRQVGQQTPRSQDHLPSCWYAKSANGHVHDPHFSSWKVGAEACIMDFVEVHDGCPSSEKIPGLVGEIQRVWAKNSPIFSVFCVFQQHRCVTLGLLYDWSLQLSKLAWNANLSSCCLFSKFSRCRMKKKMMMVIIVMTMMTTMTMSAMTMMLLLTMTTMTTKRDADEEDEEDLCDDSDVGFVGPVLPFEIMLKGTTPWSSSSGYVRRLRGWCRFLKVGWHMKFLLQLECHIFFWGGISNLVNIVSCDKISQNMDHQLFDHFYRIF